MGTIACCGESKGYISKNLHIYQINRYYSGIFLNKIIDMKNQSLLPDSQRESKITEISSIENRDSVKENSNLLSQGQNQINNINSKRGNSKLKPILKNDNGEFQLLSYDLGNERFSKFKVIFRITKSIEGLSELCIKSNFYLCGISPKKQNEGSYLFKINLDSLSEQVALNAELLINSQYQHVYPSLISYIDDIICVGGNGQKHCELYNNSLNKWFLLPNLPEERYKCTLCIDPKEKYLYLFGGINIKDKDNNSKDVNNNKENKILRLDLIKQLVWENLFVNNDSKSIIINRFSAASFVFKNDEDFLFLLGGKDSDNNYLDDIIRFSIKKCKFESTGAKLPYKAKFVHQYGILQDDQIYCFIDSLNNIHTVDRHDCLPMDYQPTEI